MHNTEQSLGFGKIWTRKLSQERKPAIFPAKNWHIAKQLRNPINGSTTIDGIPVFWGIKPSLGPLNLNFYHHLSKTPVHGLFSMLFSQSCIMHVADLNPMWCKHPVEDNVTKRLSICETLQKDITRLMTSIEYNPHTASELWIIAIICPAGMHTLSAHNMFTLTDCPPHQCNETPCSTTSRGFTAQRRFYQVESTMNNYTMIRVPSTTCTLAHTQRQQHGTHTHTPPHMRMHMHTLSM